MRGVIPLVWVGVFFGSIGCEPRGGKDSGKSPPPASAAPATAPATAQPPKPAFFEKAKNELPQRRSVTEAARRLVTDRLEFLPVATDGPLPTRPCFQPLAVDVSSIDPHRSLFVHDDATLKGADFSLAKTLDKLAADATAAGASTTGEAIFKELWDTQGTAPGIGTGAHCNDTTVGSESRLNDFNYQCPRPESTEASAAGAIDKYIPIGLVNRLDLAGANWQNCGEHRIIYGRTGAPNGGRNFIIFEAVLPNPKPGCAAACRPVADFWRSLSAIDNPAVRSAELEKFYYKGLPGFKEVVHVRHYSAKGVSSTYGGGGSGQIRTNQFILGPGGIASGFNWMLREFKTSISCVGAACALDIVPVTDKLDPFGRLFDESVASGSGEYSVRAAEFQSDFVASAADLGNPDLNAFSYPVTHQFNQGQSEVKPGPVDDYFVAANLSVPGAPGGFKADLAAAAPMGLTPRHLLNRATALSCAGCHQPGTFGLGATDAVAPAPTGSWPNSLGFVHATEATSTNAQVAGIGDTTRFGTLGGHKLSDALNNVFLPARASFLAGFLSEKVCRCRPRLLPFDPILKGKILVKLPRTLTPKDRAFEAEFKALDAAATRGPGAFAAAAKTLDTSERAELRRLDALVVEAGGQPLPIPDATAARLDLSEIAALDADPAKARRQRIDAVQVRLAAEPPRQSVTGSFRVH